MLKRAVRFPQSHPRAGPVLPPDVRYDPSPKAKARKTETPTATSSPPEKPPTPKKPGPPAQPAGSIVLPSDVEAEEPEQPDDGTMYGASEVQHFDCCKNRSEKCWQPFAPETDLGQKLNALIKDFKDMNHDEQQIFLYNTLRDMIKNPVNENRGNLQWLLLGHPGRVDPIVKAIKEGAQAPPPDQ
eukprot:9495716-Pyramimonas_sp.AAC.1